MVANAKGLLSSLNIVPSTRVVEFCPFAVMDVKKRKERKNNTWGPNLFK
jgi:hypothetical protein